MPRVFSLEKGKKTRGASLIRFIYRQTQHPFQFPKKRRGNLKNESRGGFSGVGAELAAFAVGHLLLK